MIQVHGVQSEVQAPDDAPPSIYELQSMSASHPRSAMKAANAQPSGWRGCDQDREWQVRPIKPGSAVKRVPGSWRQLKTAWSRSNALPRKAAATISGHSTDTGRTEAVPPRPGRRSIALRLSWR